MSMLLCFAAPAQDQARYNELVKDAWQQYENKEYLKSAQTYSTAFGALGGKGTQTDRYNAACSWALAGESDSAFYQLFYIAERNYTNYNHITTDTDLASLHEDPRWKDLQALIWANKEKEEAHYDKELVAVLDTVYREDQKYRMQIAAVREKFGWESVEMQDLLRKMDVADSINLVKVKKILDEHGWLGADSIGRHGNLTLFLVIQHADLETQEQYLPMMREAVKKGRAAAANLALLEDRVALRKGGKQIYGSQIGTNQTTGEYYLLPLTDPDNVDKRRAEVGLGPLQEYLSRWKLTWNAEEYKKNLPQLLEMEKK